MASESWRRQCALRENKCHHVAETSDAGLGRNWYDSQRLSRQSGHSVWQKLERGEGRAILEDICEKSHQTEAKVPETEKKAASPKERIKGKQALRYRTVWSSSRSKSEGSNAMVPS